MVKGDEPPVLRILRQRGLRVCQKEPAWRTIHHHLGTGEPVDRFNQLFQSYSYRIFLRDLITFSDMIHPERFGPFIDRERIETYMDFSLELGLVKKVPGGTYSFSFKDITDIGDTFEYALSLILEDMGFDVTWGVKFEGIESGGDFDIIGLASGKLFYLEAKTSPPKHIEMSEMRNFLDRITSLRPDFAIFINDTHLRMKDKLVPLMESDIEARSGLKLSMNRIEREIFGMEGFLYIMNTKRDIPGNIRVCVEDFFQSDWEKRYLFFT